MNRKKYELNKIYKFDIKGFGSFTDKRGNLIDSIILDIDNNSIQVRALPWQNNELWNYNNIYCEIIGYTKNGYFKLRTKDDRHPLYEKGEIYDFKFQRVVNKINNKTGGKLLVIKMLDSLGYEYDVTALPNQENTLQKDDIIKCRVIDINTKLNLSQEKSKDPYFYSFEEIIRDKKMRNNYFLCYLDNIIEVDYPDLYAQYKSKSAFWVFTYCNIFLPKYFYNSIKENRYKEALEIAMLWLEIEEWIINSPILNAFNNDDRKLDTEIKIKDVIEKLSIRIDILNFLIKNDNDYLLTFTEVDTLKLLEYISLCNFENTNELLFIEKILSLSEIDEIQKYHLNKIGNIIESNKKTYVFENLNEDYFIESTELSQEKESKISVFLNWSYCQYLIYSLTGEILQSNLIAAQIMRFFSQKVQQIQKKEILLYYAFYILSNKNTKYLLPISFENNRVSLNDESLQKNPNLHYTSDYWQDIKQKKERIHKVNIVEKYYKGYKVEIKNTKGFLLDQNIYDLDLKRYPSENIEWETNVLIHLYSEEFNFFIAKQLNLDDPNFYSQNLIRLLEVGEVVHASVISIVEYGVFVSTPYGDGLLHRSNLADGHWDKYHLEKFFKIGEKIYVINLKTEEYKRRYEFGFEQLIDTPYKEYYQKFMSHDRTYYHRIDEENLYDRREDINKTIEIEKGRILEQFAMTQENFENKINSIKIAKHFYANINNARSYLHNIYIQYFTALNDLDILIENYSFEGYDIFRETIKAINIQEQTLEVFSEGEKLIFFVKVLSLFNSDDEDQNYSLMDYAKKHSNAGKSHAIFKILAKTTLANNLLLSEVQKTDNKNEALDFSLKNLKRIRDYIKNGVFSLAENQEDKLERETREKIKEWKDKINLEEGENMEFKSTFKTPVPNGDSKKRLEILQDKLKNNPNDKAKMGINAQIDEINGSKAMKRIIHSAFKSIAAFANTSGGVLLLGVSDDKKIFGLEKDYASFKDEQNRDGFGKFFDAKIKEYFGDSFSSTHLEKEFLKFTEGDILIVKVKKSIEEIFLLKDDEGKPTEDIYVRNLSSTDKLLGKELAKFIRKKSSERI
ncbi:RNA-binding domain-containing protein [Bernardetia sp. OM2101]|uniref:RNA-binding domain-containing protein n=1 Tax=Bernardetia sp. OM2101 TaxID=3344876 RepID=UPI0035CFF08F